MELVVEDSHELAEDEEEPAAASGSTGPGAGQGKRADLRGCFDIKKIFNEEIDLRNSIASSYDSLITNELITKPKIADGHQSVYALYTIQTEFRDELISFLNQDSIPSGIYYQIPLHKQLAFKDCVADNLELSEKLCERVLSIPMHPYLQLEEIEKITSVLNEFKK